MRFLCLLVSAAWLWAGEPAGPLRRAHAHNDYEHRRPLLDALAEGFTSVEADVHLKNGELLVAHDPEQTSPGRTLAKLYLDPLRGRAKENGGRIFRGGPPVILLIDVKTDAASTYAALEKELKRYRGMLTRFTPEGIVTNAVMVILSGNRPRAELERGRKRLAAFDGRLADLGQGLPVSFMPLVSDNWRAHFKWNGEGALPDAEKAKLGELVKQAHGEGRMIRFWATPDTRAAWQALREAGVDLLNTDDLEGLAKFLRAEPAPAPQ